MPPNFNDLDPNTAMAKKGNQNAKKENRLWADAIRRAIVSGKKLGPLAEKLIAKATEGDMAAMKEIGDRLDGKPAQIVQGTGENGEFVFKWQE